MIMRQWSGWAPPDQPDGYPRHFHEKVVPELTRLAGFLGATLCTRESAGCHEFMVLTRWRSMDAIRAFAGDEPERAVVEPGAVAVLGGFDSFVTHYEVVEDVAAP